VYEVRPKEGGIRSAENQDSVDRDFDCDIRGFAGLLLKGGGAAARAAGILPKSIFSATAAANKRNTPVSADNRRAAADCTCNPIGSERFGWCSW